MGVAVRIAAVVVALAFAGCGDGDDDTEPGDIGHSYPASAHKEVLCKASVAAVRCLAADPKWDPAARSRPSATATRSRRSRSSAAKAAPISSAGPGRRRGSRSAPFGRPLDFETKSVSCRSVRGGFDCQKKGSPDVAFELTDDDFSLNGQQ